MPLMYQPSIWDDGHEDSVAKQMYRAARERTTSKMDAVKLTDQYARNHVTLARALNAGVSVGKACMADEEGNPRALDFLKGR